MHFRNKNSIIMIKMIALKYYFLPGLKSYGKVVFLFSLAPAFGMLVLCTKLLGLAPHGSKIQIGFPQTEWSEFFVNSKVIIIIHRIFYFLFFIK